MPEPRLPWTCPNPEHAGQAAAQDGMMVCPCGITSKHTDDQAAQALRYLLREVEEYFPIALYPPPTDTQRHAATRMLTDTIKVPLDSFTAEACRAMLNTLYREAADYRTPVTDTTTKDD